MEINRTGLRVPLLEDPAQKAERTAARFRSPAPQPSDPGATAAPPGVPPGVTQADLRDAGKADQIVRQVFGDMLNKAGQQPGVPVSDAQKRDLLEFLGNDPVMRGKLLNYLEQNVK